MLSAIITTSDLPNLAREINDAHRQVRMHAKGMLLEAKRAGEALLVAKQQCAHGEFLSWLRANCPMSLRQAQRYMQLAKRDDVDAFDPDASIESVLNTKAKAKPKAQPFTRVDAEHVMKLQRLADSTANENEAAVAQSKLDDFASRFDMTAEEAVVKSRKELDLDWVEQKQQLGTVESAMVRVIEKKLGPKSQEDLLKIIIQMVFDHPENLSTLKDYLK